MELDAGTEVASGRYVVESVLGVGGMAAVYRVRHVELGTPFALKVLTAATPDQRSRLLREGRAQAALRHTHIVSVADVVEVEGQPALVMEYVDGPPLDRLLKRVPLTLEQVDDLARGILTGVAAAHRAGFIHRDLKPGNVLLAVDDDRVVAKVADFGLVKSAVTAGGMLGATRTGALMGTPAYMAPEQIRDAKDVDARADVFALGAILYELLTRRRAFEGEDTFDVFEAVVKGRYRPLSGLMPDLPERMRRAVEQALAVDPDERFPTAVALRDAWTEGAGALDMRSVWSPDELGAVRAAAPAPPGAPTGEDVSSLDAARPDTLADSWRDPTVDAPPSLPAQTLPAPGSVVEAPPTDEVSASPARRPPTRMLGLVALALVVAGVVGAWTWGGSERVAFTVDGIPKVYDSPDEQAALEQAWERYLDLDDLGAAKAFLPLLEREVIPPSVAILAYIQAEDLGLTSRLDDILRRVDPVALEEDDLPAICAKGLLAHMSNVVGGARVSQATVHARAQTARWLDDHPEDVLGAICLTTLPASESSSGFSEDVLVELARSFERADPDQSSALVLRNRAGLERAGTAHVLRMLRDAVEADPTSVSKRLLLSYNLSTSSDGADQSEACELVEAAVRDDPVRLDLRIEAAAQALLMGDEAALERHLATVLMPEWGTVVACSASKRLHRPALRAGRPTLARQLRSECGVGNLNDLLVASQVYGLPAYASLDMLVEDRRLVEELLLESGAGPLRMVLEALAARLDVLTALHSGRTPSDGVIARADQLDPEGKPNAAWVAAWDGDPEPMLAYWDGVAATLPPTHDGKVFCTGDITRAFALERAGRHAQAMKMYRSVLDGCPDIADQALRAMAAGVLALDARERGDETEEARYLERVQAEWPIAEDTLPLMQALWPEGTP